MYSQMSVCVGMLVGTNVTKKCHNFREILRILYD